MSATRAASARVFSAGWLLAGPDDWSNAGGVVVERGRVVRVLRGAGEVRRAHNTPGVTGQDLGSGLLAPGFVNAHTHLELSDLAGALPSFERESAGDFATWVGALLRRRATSGAPSEEVVVRGAEECLATGTTCVGDIDSGAPRDRLRRRGPRVRQYREVLDIGLPERRAAAEARVARRLGRHARILEGLSPHAPFTVSDELLRHVSRLRKRRAVPVAMHWAESVDERAWASSEPSALRELVPASTPGPGLERLERAGLLAPWTSLVHANHATPDEVERVRRSGASVVHCPGSHTFFGRAAFDLERWSGVNVALGTDSSASNEALDMRREMALLRRAHPHLDPREVWRMATTCGARALALEGEVGALEPGAWADFALHEVGASTQEEQLEELTGGMIPVAGVWIAGRAARPDRA